VLATIIIGFGFYFFIGSEMMPLADVGQAYGAWRWSRDVADRDGAAVSGSRHHPEAPRGGDQLDGSGGGSAFESTGAYYTGMRCRR